MRSSGIAPGDILADSGYSHRVPGTWAQPPRAAGANLVQDLHPIDRGPQGIHQGAIIARRPVLPRHPRASLELEPLPPGAKR